MYRLTSNQGVSLEMPVFKVKDGAFIPPAEDNADYQEYLAWVAEGNTPEPAIEPEPAPVLTTEQKLEAAGLTVAELRELLNLPAE